MEEYIIDAKSTEIVPLFIGREACEPSHSYGPYVRDYYIVHFCLNGHGRLENRHGTFDIGAGQLFVIREGEVTTYTADKNEPWEYIWIAFRSGGEYFTDGRSVFDTPNGIDDKLLRLLSDESASYEGCVALIYELIYNLFSKGESEGDEKIRRVRRYIKYNYMKKISVTSLADSFGFERSYLYRIFKKRYGVGIKDYITALRLEKATEFLRSGFTVKESAHLVGYEDEFNFSKAFKKRYGFAPSRLNTDSRISQ